MRSRREFLATSVGVSTALLLGPTLRVAAAPQPDHLQARSEQHRDSTSDAGGAAGGPQADRQVSKPPSRQRWPR